MQIKDTSHRLTDTHLAVVRLQCNCPASIRQSFVMTLQLGVGLGTIPKKYVIKGTVNKKKKKPFRINFCINHKHEVYLITISKFLNKQMLVMLTLLWLPWCSSLQLSQISPAGTAHFPHLYI